MAMRCYSALLAGKSLHQLEMLAIKSRLVLGVRAPAAMLMRRSFSNTTTTTTTTTPSDSSSSAPTSSCDIIKGPSLLRTTNQNRPRPSLVHLPGLRSLPFWSQLDANHNETRVAYQDPTLSWVVQHMEQNWPVFLHEYQQAILHNDNPKNPVTSDYQVDTEHNDKLLHQGHGWDWHSYMLKGQAAQAPFLQHFPESARVLQELRDAKLLFENVPFGYAFFSTLHPQSQIDAHSAPMNFRVRLHLPLIVPTEEESNDNNNNDDDSNQLTCGIRVGPTTRAWVPGKALLLDDSFDHQVWNNSPDQARVVLLVDVWHPDVTPQERQEIVQLFDHAKQQGWWGSEESTK